MNPWSDSQAELMHHDLKPGEGPDSHIKTTGSYLFGSVPNALDVDPLGHLPFWKKTAVPTVFLLELEG